jgi:shikimate kinase
VAVKNIVLAGFMGTGKTAVSKELSRLAGFATVDVDAEIEKSAGMAIKEIFKQFGEPRFRDMETEAIKKVSEKTSTVISTGGGAVLRQENMDALRRGGIVVCLTATPETILERTNNSDERPLLQVEDPVGKIKELLDFRKPYYEQADVMIDTEGKTPLQVAEEILERIKIQSTKS